ncbi:MAG: mechanosensitive ion channel [Pseudomonadota bacterium]|nr:mechanosensitive ion channel [Pseudomonadota bacterium]
MLLIGWMLVVAPFGADATDIFGRITSTDLVIHVGTTSISPGTILGGILILAVGVAVTRGVRGWLESRYLPATEIDIGVRASLASAVTYLGVIIAVVVASVFLGVSLDRITLFASALSIGIGFGLQSIISNFVSGLILLVERPVKVGDWIAIGDLEGDIRKINVRATEIEMKDQSRLIVPNLDLVTKTVRNVTHAGALGRARIVFRVNDDADPIALRTMVLDVLAKHSEVLEKPAPAAYLTDATDGGLEFTCFAFVASARDVFRIRSDLLFAIVPALRAAGFALANSTPIVNLGVDSRLIEPAAVPPGPASNG